MSHIHQYKHPIWQFGLIIFYMRGKLKLNMISDVSYRCMPAKISFTTDYFSRRRHIFTTCADGAGKIISSSRLVITGNIATWTLFTTCELGNTIFTTWYERSISQSNLKNILTNYNALMPYITLILDCGTRGGT